MNKRKIFRIVIMVLIMILLVASPALAEATKTEWWEQSTYCYVSCPEGEVCDRLVDGKIYQRRGLVQHIDVLSFDPNDGNPIEIPELHGTITSIATVNYNFDTGNG